MRFNRRIEARLRRYHTGESLRNLWLRHGNAHVWPRTVARVLTTALGAKYQHQFAARPFTLYCHLHSIEVALDALPFVVGTTSMPDLFFHRHGDGVLVVVTVLEGASVWSCSDDDRVMFLAPTSRIKPCSFAPVIMGNAIIACVCWPS